MGGADFPAIDEGRREALAASTTSRLAVEALGSPGTSTLRILFVTEEDPLYVISFFDVFLQNIRAQRSE